MRRFIFIFAFLLILDHEKGEAQETQRYNDVWFFLINHYQIDKNWTVGNELHLRRVNWLKNPNQFLIRPFVSYKPSDAIVYSFGYTYIQSFPFGDSPIQIDFPEHNLWEQIILNHKVGTVNVSHRYRLENRFLAKIESNEQLNGFTFANRFRYRLTLIQPLSQHIFLHLFNEFWLRMNGDFSEATYDRNWIYVGLGYKLSSLSNLQLAYLHQHIVAQNQFEVHPSVQLSLQVDFGK